jgi:hypothetical protein
MLLAINTHLYETSLLGSVYLFLAIIATDEPIPENFNEKLVKCKKLFGHWYT